MTAGTVDVQARAINQTTCSVSKVTRCKSRADVQSAAQTPALWLRELAHGLALRRTAGMPDTTPWNSPQASREECLPKVDFVHVLSTLSRTSTHTYSILHLSLCGTARQPTSTAALCWSCHARISRRFSFRPIRQFANPTEDGRNTTSLRLSLLSALSLSLLSLADVTNRRRLKASF